MTLPEIAVFALFALWCLFGLALIPEPKGKKVMNDYESMYWAAADRYHAVVDAVFAFGRRGDWPGLINAVAENADACDYVDEESIAAYQEAFRQAMTAREAMAQ